MIGATSAARGGRPKAAPSSSPPKNQKSTTMSDQMKADQKNVLGLGKKETNTAGDPSMGSLMNQYDRTISTNIENRSAFPLSPLRERVARAKGEGQRRKTPHSLSLRLRTL